MSIPSHYVFGRDTFPPRTVVLVSAATALPALIGFWGTFDLIKGIYASVYLIGVIAWYLLIQVKLRCANCRYYNKLCPRGLGKLAPRLYRADTGAPALGGKLAKWFWPLWFAGLPALAFLLLLAIDFSWTTLVFAGAFAVTTPVYFIIERRFCCAECLNRGTCLRLQSLLQKDVKRD
jgi:hypothetical protein